MSIEIVEKSRVDVEQFVEGEAFLHMYILLEY